MKHAIRKRIRLNVAKKIYKQIRKTDLPKTVVLIAKEANNNNIMVDFFEYLVQAEDKNVKDYRVQVAAIKLYEMRFFLKTFGYESESDLVKQLDESLEKYRNIFQVGKASLNLEANLTKNYLLDDELKDAHFAFDNDYKIIGAIFETAFSNSLDHFLYYEFAYYCQMYIHMNFRVNKNLVPENYELYLAKLDIQMHMIRTLARTTPANYNILIRRLNTWFDKVEKIQYKYIKKNQKQKRVESREK